LHMPLVVPSETCDNENNLEAKNIPLLATHLIVILSCSICKVLLSTKRIVLTVANVYW
jgi:hypothetical protein